MNVSRDVMGSLSSFNKFEEAQSQTLDQARSLWHAFNLKFETVTGDESTLKMQRIMHAKKLETCGVFDNEKSEAATKIASWWREFRNSKKMTNFNPNGAHPNEFYTLLSGHNDIKRKFDHDNDIVLLEELNTNPWQSNRFRNPETHYNALNLFATGKISWQQKATLSLIIDTAQVFGEFEAIALLNEEGNDFSEKAKPLIKDYIRYFPIHTISPFYDPSNGFLTPEETRLLFALVLQLPKSEQFIFHFKEQHGNDLNPNGSPSADVNARFSYARLLNRSSLGYQGVLFFSHGIRNAIGLSHYGVEDWVPIIPRLGLQTIDDVETIGKKGGRLTISAESHKLGLVGAKVNVHGTMLESPDQFVHDEFHSLVASILGNKVLKAIDTLIEQTRSYFGVRWSKDIWILRDGDLSKLQTHARDIKNKTPEYTTRFFSSCIDFKYASTQLDNCPQEVQKLVARRPLLLGTDGFPSQIILNFALDLVLNQEKWSNLHILAEEKLYTGVMCRLISMVKYLKVLDIFKEHNEHNAKAHILMFDYFVRSQGQCYSAEDDGFDINITWLEWKMPKNPPQNIFMEMQEIGDNADDFVVAVQNKKLLFGFVKNPNPSLQRQIEKNPALRRDSVWVKAQFLKACETANTTDVAYYFDKLNEYHEFELVNEGISLAPSLAFFDWIINKSQFLKISEKNELFPDDFTDTSETSDNREKVNPDIWTNNHLIALKESQTNTDNELFQMRTHYINYLIQKRSLLQSKTAI